MRGPLRLWHDQWDVRATVTCGMGTGQQVWLLHSQGNGQIQHLQPDAPDKVLDITTAASPRRPPPLWDNWLDA